jgi:hypothetical protein
MAQPPISGRCNCGQVTFTLTGSPESVGYCHCTRCQRRTGAGSSAQARIDSQDLEITSGEDRLSRWRHRDGGFAKLFCTVCGSHLFSASPEHPRQMGVRLGALDPGHGLRPTFRQFTAYAAAWEPIPEDGLDRFPESRGRPTLD